jgi:hypothetical protein
MKSLIERAKIIESEGFFTGGRPANFEIAGRKLFIMLLKEGIMPSSRVVDIGCGCLRAGYWLIHFLDPGNYCGIEPNVKMLDSGLRNLLEPGLVESKRPRFQNNTDFKLTGFNEKFDMFVALSIWTHAAKPQIRAMLDGFVQTSAENAAFIATYHPTTLLKRDYTGDRWVGRSHESDSRGMVNHSFGWIQRECASRGLVAEGERERAYRYYDQTWVKIRRKQRG